MTRLLSAFHRAIGNAALSIGEALRAARWARCLAAMVTAASAVAVTHAPAAAHSSGFGDVDEGASYSVPVTELAARGVFAGTGCDQGFCPDEPIDRKTMAVWTVRVVTGQEPPAVAQARFGDVDPGSFYGPFVDQMAQLGITQGCGDGANYCPDNPVSRAEMAVFLTRAFDLPDGPDPGFIDVAAGAWYGAEVAALAASGITRGCGDGTVFCPDQDTTRGQMATFLARALGLVESPDSEPPDTTEDNEEDALAGDYVSSEYGFTPEDVAWWRQPRGETRVKIHVCAERGFEHLFSPSYLTAYADAANEQIAPFYAWQSSGRLDLRFEPGQIVATDLLVGTISLVPLDCLAEPNIGRSGVVHHYLVYGQDYTVHCWYINPDGCASLGGPNSATYLRPRTGRDLTPRRLFVLQHELDHNLNVPHLNGTETGYTRLAAWDGNRPITVGTLAGYPDIPRLRLPLFDEAGDTLRDEAGNPQEGYWVFPCYILVRLGWPMGEGHPACSRYGPPEVRDIAGPTDPDGTFRVTWQPPPTDLNPEPVTGYEIELFEVWRGDAGSTRTFSVGAGTTSLALPSLELYVPYVVSVWATSAAGAGDRSPPVVIRYYGPAAQIRVADRSNAEWAVYDLSWDPVPGASHYQVSGFENCTYTFSPGSQTFCSEQTETASLTLSEERTQLVAGRSYEINVFACGEGLDETRPEWPHVTGCFVYGTTTISAQTRGLEAVQFTPVDGCFYFDGVDLENAVGQCYLAEWAPHPDATSYDAFASCHRDIPPHGDPGETSISVSNTSVTADFAFEFGQRCQVDVFIDWGCPANAGACALYARGWVTVPARGS